MASCLDAIQVCGTDVNIIVRGYTSKLQVLDVDIHQLFEGYVRVAYENRMVEKNSQTPLHMSVRKWVSKAWDKVKEE
jgi:hypothetical protein